MKILIVLLVIPLFSIGQTVHIKDEKIVYEGAEKISNAAESEIFNRIQKALPSLVSSYQINKQSSNAIMAAGQFRLHTPYSVIRTVTYSIELNATQAGYNYIIDSVMFTEQKRGEKAITKPSKEILENIGEAGKIVGESEKILNETDMRIQKLLALLKQQVAKE